MVFSITCSKGLDGMMHTSCTGIIFWDQEKLWFSTPFGISTRPCSGDLVDDTSRVRIDPDPTSLFISDERVDGREDIVAKNST
jgi:hypothetical protein